MAHPSVGTRPWQVIMRPTRTAPGISGPMVLIGVLAFLVANAAVLLALNGHPPISLAVVIGAAVVACSASLLVRRDRDARGVGIGLLIGWSLATLLSDGALTGLG
ncbi:hypothetical protein ACFPM7_24250 [Actinokineospora guangxiensis]|uniref:DUF4190 domain-containing protein n=1 Tax=Actinokineospora guangxiensis TaxID=1490288 RepID=A0ABW0EX85_9PSEU